MKQTAFLQYVPLSIVIIKSHHIVRTMQLQEGSSSCISNRLNNWKNNTPHSILLECGVLLHISYLLRQLRFCRQDFQISVYPGNVIKSGDIGSVFIQNFIGCRIVDDFLDICNGSFELQVQYVASDQASFQYPVFLALERSSVVIFAGRAGCDSNGSVQDI